MDSVSFEIKIGNQLGLHARPASIFVRTASNFDSEVLVEKDGEVVNGKSLIGLLMLAAGHGSDLKISVQGSDAGAAAEALRAMAAGDKVFNEE